MFAMMLVIAFVSWFLEMSLDYRFRFLYRWSRDYPLCNLLVSLALSWALCQLFITSGLIALGAGLLSTFMSWVTFRIISAGQWVTRQVKRS